MKQILGNEQVVPLDVNKFNKSLKQIMTNYNSNNK